MKKNLIELTICRFQPFSENIVWHQSQKALTQLQQLESLSLEMWASTPNMPWLANLSIAPSGYNSPLKSVSISSTLSAILFFSLTASLCLLTSVGAGHPWTLWCPASELTWAPWTRFAVLLAPWKPAARYLRPQAFRAQNELGGVPFVQDFWKDRPFSLGQAGSLGPM